MKVGRQYWNERYKTWREVPRDMERVWDDVLAAREGGLSWPAIAWAMAHFKDVHFSDDYWRQVFANSPDVDVEMRKPRGTPFVGKEIRQTNGLPAEWLQPVPRRLVA